VTKSCTGCASALLILAAQLLSAQEYSFRYFGLADGLSNLAVRQIYQDRAGFLWVSTENGVFRYDGDRFEEFGPAQGFPANYGVAFGDAPDGSLLVAGGTGVYRLAGNRFERVASVPGTVSWAEGIQPDGKGHTYLGTDKGLLRLSGASGPGPSFDVERFAQAPGSSGPGAYGVFIDGDAVWYGCGFELCRRDSTGTTVYGRLSGLPRQAILAIQKDGSGDLWVRARNAGTFVLPRGQPHFRRPDSPVPPGSLVGVPSTDSGGRMLLPSAEGLVIHGEAGWQIVGASAGLRGTPYAAWEDRKGGLWVGLAGRGLAHWRGYREWESYTIQSGLPTDLVYEILPAPDRSVWIATEAGLFRGVRKKAAMKWLRVPGVGAFPVHSVRLAPDRDIWIGTETHGAARIHNGSVEWFDGAKGLTGKAPYTLRFDREKRLWAATEAGLFVAHSPYREFSRVAELPVSRFWTVTQASDGTVWAGGADGLFVVSSGRWTRLDPRSLSNREVMSLAAGPDGSVWVGYRFGKGIDRLSLGPGGVAVSRGVQRTGTDGIVYFLEFDNSGRLWAGTERGVDVWNGARWSHFDSNNGLVWDDRNLNAFATEPDGAVWVGTSGGLSRYTPVSRTAPDTVPAVVFTRLVMGHTDLSQVSTPHYASHATSLRVRYSALNVAHENGVVFRYRLPPANSAWTETSQRDLEFAQLAPGSYELEVQARDQDGVWTGERSTPGKQATFSFEVLSPWYVTSWFFGLCGLAPVTAVAASLRIRMLHARKRERELVLIVEERTQDLRRANEDLLRLSSLDPLTGLSNRRILDDALRRECAGLQRTGETVSLVLVDIDHFKALNDSLGHQRGDQYLMLVGAQLRRLTRGEPDIAARYGGEEFALVLPETNAATAAAFAESVRQSIAGLDLPHPASPVATVLTVSLGVATAGSRRTPEELIAAADQALYLAKRKGRNRVEIASPCDAACQMDNDRTLETLPSTRALQN
jgi:diguanylate cyclase (GGDEF)-like protein